MTEQITDEQARAIVKQQVGWAAVHGRQYPAALPPELARWYVYTADGGHCILAAIASLQEAMPERPSAFLIPAPVKAVVRAGYQQTQEGYIKAELMYDHELGLVAPAGTDEY